MKAYGKRHEADCAGGEARGRFAVGVAYDEAFLLHRSPVRGHEERPARLVAITNALKEIGLWDALTPISCRPASDSELLRIHTKGYLGKMQRMYALKGCELQAALEQANLDTEDVYFNQHTLPCARLAAGSCVECVSQVVSGRSVDSAIAIVRPPGHHSPSHCAQGFCVFNNVAIAARHATDVLGLTRVLIVDWDVHHGNGTAQSFMHDSRVLYFSVHRHDFGKFYPSSSAGSPKVVGTGQGAGYNVSVAWNGQGMGDAEYLYAWERVLLPIAHQYQPQLIVVSAGFDAACGDDMGKCNVTPEGYAMLLSKLTSFAGGKIVVALEGGYHLPSLAGSVAACVEVLVGAPHVDERLQAHEARVRRQPVQASAVASCAETAEAHAAFWKLL